MKIKRERQVRLDELIGYITKNELISSVFKSNRGNEIGVDINGDLSFFGRFNYNDLFVITEEVDITEDTLLQRAMVIKNNLEFYRIKNRKISRLDTMNIKFIYLQKEDGSIGELIWSKERGLID
ncbi:hypothetical protein EVU91_04505 [Macrococcoides bohemicum]|uniref:hypothetical protein n=1 Tax=Macrococcoides bohemicum TaxID=1903056 RepID=UPI0010598CF0|nr:hypothetical protein [Macrococcus bohemicus]TDL39410.1 hypothetical protein EVU91_04505 [Macrococcus bohemicus]